MQQYTCIRFLENVFDLSFTDVKFSERSKNLVNNILGEGRLYRMANVVYPKDTEIVTIYPEYTEEGDITRMLCKEGGELQLRSSVDSVLNRLALRSNHSLSQVRTWLYRDENDIVGPSRHLGGTLGLSPMLIMIPFKARSPIVSSDGAYGYVNYKYLKDVRPSGRKDKYVTELVLKDGRTLLSMWRIPTINRRVEEAERIQHRFILIGHEIMAEMHNLFGDHPYHPWDKGYRDTERIPKETKCKNKKEEDEDKL